MSDSKTGNVLVQLGRGRPGQLEELRRSMGTQPDQHPEFKTPFYRGVEGITVELTVATDNPYKAMYDMATTTWGKKPRKWGDVSPESRAMVVRAVLARQALPLALEAPQFTFAIDKISRWAFDQLARARLGVVFSSMGTRDNCHLDIGFRFHEATWRNPEKLRRAQAVALHAKEEYRWFIEESKASWQEARELLPISCTHFTNMSINYAALSNMCSRRMSFSEAEDVVAVAWLLRNELMNSPRGAPLLGAYLRPSCDFSGSCNYHKAYSFSEAFSCLFKACGRNPVRGMDRVADEYEYAEFNESCTDRETLMKQLGIYIPLPNEERPETFALTDRDWQLFNED